MTTEKEMHRSFRYQGPEWRKGSTHKMRKDTFLSETDFHKTLIETSPAFITVINSKGHLLMMNQNMLDTLGYTKQEIIGKEYLSIFVPEEERGICQEAWDKLIKLQGPAKNENHIIAKDGRSFLVEWHGRSILEANGELDFFLGIGIDITERRRAELKLQEAFSEIKRLKNRLEAENIYLRQEIKLKYGNERIIGRSEAIKNILTQIELVAATDSTVLILGETGTGKELVVEALHFSSARDREPLIKVNCSALSETILESELFGHVRGAFSGAIRDKIGRFQAAEGGSIFLDEIGEISPRIQVKLLRFIDMKEYERVGESKTRKADVRIMAATNANLEDKVRRGTFRADLFYRLKIMTLYPPPLRERDGDIPLLVDKFFHEYARLFGKEIVGLDDEVMGIFLDYPWPGNVRELKHTIEHACLLCCGNTIHKEHLPKNIQTQTPVMTGLERKTFIGPERIVEALRQSSWKKAGAARLLGVHRSTLYRMIDRYDLANIP